MEIVYDFDLNYPPDGFESKDNLLVIDDVVDTGRTFSDIKEVLDLLIEEIPTFQYKLAAIHYKPGAIIKPEIYLQEVPNDTWVVYPWEHLDDRKYEREAFKLRRKKELAIETGQPVVTATQRPKNVTQKMQKQDQIIWKSFLHEE